MLAVPALALVAGARNSDVGPDAESSGGRTTGTTGRDAADGAQPSIRYVLADDMTVDDLQHLPTLQRLVGDEGVTFERSYVSDSSCCPSRTSMRRGQCSHDTGIESNRGNGGVVHLHEQGLEESTIGTWLQDAGYPSEYTEFDYRLNDDGRVVEFGGTRRRREEDKV